MSSPVLFSVQKQLNHVLLLFDVISTQFSGQLSSLLDMVHRNINQACIEMGMDH